MTDLEWQILINFGPLAAFVLLWVLISRFGMRRQGSAVTVVSVNTEEMRRLNANIERLIAVLDRRPPTGDAPHG